MSRRTTVTLDSFTAPLDSFAASQGRDHQQFVASVLDAVDERVTQLTSADAPPLSYDLVVGRCACWRIGSFALHSNRASRVRAITLLLLLFYVLPFNLLGYALFIEPEWIYYATLNAPALIFAALVLWVLYGRPRRIRVCTRRYVRAPLDNDDALLPTREAYNEAAAGQDVRAYTAALVDALVRGRVTVETQEQDEEFMHALEKEAVHMARRDDPAHQMRAQQASEESSDTESTD